MWTYDREEKIVSKVNLGRVYRITNLEADADQADPLRPFRGLEWTSIRYTADEIFEERPHRVFEAKPKVNLLHRTTACFPCQSTIAHQSRRWPVAPGWLF